MFKAIMAAGLVSVMASAAGAETVYRCKISIGENNGQLPQEVVVGYDAVAQTAVVFDPFINMYVGKPIAARIATDNAARLTIAWDFENIQSTANRNIRRVQFRATIVKATNKMHITSTQFFSDSNSGSGTCVVK